MDRFLAGSTSIKMPGLTGVLLGLTLWWQQATVDRLQVG